MSTLYSIHRKCRIWYRKIALEFILGSATANGWLIYNKRNEKSIPYSFFEELISKALAAVTLLIERPMTPKKVHTLSDGSEEKTIWTRCYKKLRAVMTSREADNKVKKICSHCKDCDGQLVMCLLFQ
ncbi:hypothetical protein HHI36_005195 [Cryptolaemus montrouzieri]|uniref:PiggyBac transposable element-derived protein domain-containing protein n=1 Tax=Cryptolaemus montrouzieri TaxID=559131 RepID=A0ABD2NTC6_9CUCU